ncbi:MAG: site-specific DNA-methyltransferase [Planctomycetota bacterium]|nr:site-specific DNA-methyltransferase [Planctomycetota bacterium]
MAEGRIILGDSRKMEDVADGSVHLIITSPPYNVEKPYDSHSDDLSLDTYLEMLRDVWIECYRVLVPGGRLCVNVANLFRSPYLPLNALITQQITGELPQLDCRFLMRGEIIWDKSMSVGASTAWGSFGSPTNPTLRDQHEYVMIYSKDRFARKRYEGAVADIHPDDFAKWTKSLWAMSTAKAKGVGHPSPFPEELPARLIRLYTFRGECILDPFVGSGTTCVAAKRLGRDWVGYDTSAEYVRLARDRVEAIEEEPFDPDELAALRERRRAERQGKKFRDGKKRSRKTPERLIDHQIE